MLFTLVQKSFRNRKKAVAVMIASAAAGAAISASLLALTFDVSNKVSRELRSFGANILVRPRVSGLANVSGQKRYLREEDVVKAKTIFWRHNIVGIAPELEVRDEKLGVSVLGAWLRHDLAVPGEKTAFSAGSGNVMPWWAIEGSWPSERNGVLAGEALARTRNLKTGSEVTLSGKRFVVSGILKTGGREDGMFVMELGALQNLMGLSGKVSRVYVSALTTPMDDFAYRNPDTMTKKEREKWYCTGYVTSIAKQLEDEKIFSGSMAKPIWPVAETEGKVLTRLELLVLLLTILSLLSAALGVSTTMIMGLLQRTGEIALMKAMGADSVKTIAVFLAEALLTGILSGALGYALSLVVSRYLGVAIFGTVLEEKAVLLPISAGVSVLVSVLGVYLPLRRALSIRPAEALKGAV